MTIALRAIATVLYSNYQVTLLIDDAFADLIRLAFGSQHQVLCYPRTQLVELNSWQRFKTYCQFLSELRQHHYDILLDLDGTVVSSRLTSFTKAHHKLGPSFAKRPNVYAELTPIEQGTQHCFDDYHQLIQTLGLQVDQHRYWPIPSHPEQAQIISKLGLDRHRPIACIHPSATKDYKQWHLDGFVKLSDWLSTTGWQVVIIGVGAAEQYRVENLFLQVKSRPINAYNKLSLLELVALFQVSRIFIGNDSGPMHLATASGSEVFALFGPTELTRWRPQGDRVHIIHGPAPCHPHCQPEACLYHYQCLTSLPVDDIITEISRLQVKR